MAAFGSAFVVECRCGFSSFELVLSCLGAEVWLLSLLKLKVDLDRGRVCCGSWGRSMATNRVLVILGN